MKEIKKGIIGKISKIREELEELEDAYEQEAHIMVLLELSDLVGAIKLFLKKEYPGHTLKDLEKMADITSRAFEDKERNHLSQAQDILNEIQHNIMTMNDMVGTLYPSIMTDKNNLLRQDYKDLTGEECPI